MTPATVRAAVPAAAVLVPAVSPQQLAAVRDDIDAVRRTIATLARLVARDDREIVLLVASDTWTVHHAEVATLAGYGAPHVRHVIRRGKQATVVGEALGVAVEARDTVRGEAAVLVAALGADDRRITVVSVTACAAAEAAELIDVLAASDAHVIAQGDLSAGLSERSPAYLLQGADAWDRAACQAIAAADPARLWSLGPTAANDVHARGWAPLAVLVDIAGREARQPVDVDYRAPLGVGYVTVSFASEPVPVS